MLKKVIKRGVLAGFVSTLIISCGGGGGGGGSTGTNSLQENNQGQELTGILLDSAVSGVSYQTSTGEEGLTDANGSFNYKAGEEVTFTVGRITLGKSSGSEIITPIELVGANNTADQRVINISRLLQTIDEDQNPDNGITVSTTTRSALRNRTIDFDVPISDFTNNNQAMLISSVGRTMVSAESAVNHLHSSLNQRGLSTKVASGNAVTAVIENRDTATGNDSTSTETTVVESNDSCTFRGQVVPHGSSITAYQSSSVDFGGTCSSQTRTCNDGTLSGSYSNSSCTVQSAASCNFNGQLIPHGSTVSAYQSSSVGFGDTCSSQTRSCNNGSLSGTYSYSTCTVNSANSCYFNGQTVDHGNSVTAYFDSTVPYGSTCSSQQRTCDDGSLSGYYSYSSCQQEAPDTCSFNGQTIQHGGTVTAYQSSSVAYGSTCTSQTRSCDDGYLYGSYQYSSCSVESSSAYSGNSLADRIVGYWGFVYSILSTTFTDVYVVNNYIGYEYGSSTNRYDYYYSGLDEYGNAIVATYSPTLNEYYLLDTSYYIDKFYVFNIDSNGDIYSGCYYQISSSGMSRCYTLYGTRSSLRKLERKSRNDESTAALAQSNEVEYLPFDKDSPDYIKYKMLKNSGN